MLKAKLVVVGGDAKAGEFNLTLPTVIGRGKEAGLTIPHALVSRAHTEVFERDGRLAVKDLGSLNGTFVNNTKIEGEEILEPSQLLTLGNVTFRAVYEVGQTVLNAGDTLNDRNVAATLVAPQGVSSERKTLPSGSVETESSDKPSVESVLENGLDSRSALSEIDSFEPDDSDSFGRLSEINSNVFAVQTRGPAKPRPPVETLPAAAVAASVQAKPELTPENGEHDSTTNEPAEGVQLGIETGQKHSAAVSSIDGLPSQEGPQVSFVGKIGEPVGTDDVVDEVKIDLGEDKKTSAVDESRLGSFLKRLPK